MRLLLKAMTEQKISPDRVKSLTIQSAEPVRHSWLRLIIEEAGFDDVSLDSIHTFAWHTVRHGFETIHQRYLQWQKDRKVSDTDSDADAGADAGADTDTDWDMEEDS